MCLIQYDEGIKDCDKSVERGRKFSSGYKLAAKALTREWTVLGEMEKVSRDYEPVIESYHKVLTKHRNLDVLADEE